MEFRDKNPYPSTFDMPPISGGQDDPVLAILQGALERYKASPSDKWYASNGENCAIGSIFLADGMDENKAQALGVFGAQATRDRELSQAAIEAIRLLDDTAVDVYPLYSGGGWSGPLENINQNRGIDWGKRQKMVIRVYQETIAKRKVAV